MPIKPENRARYPKDWRAIRAAVRASAGDRCEHRDPQSLRCGAIHGALGFWRRGDPFYPAEDSGQALRVWRWQPLPQLLAAAGVDRPMTMQTKEGPLKIIRIVLTVAHLDHQPENCDRANLRLMCQRHHLAYDAEHHTQSARATRRARAGAADLFEEPT